MDVMARRPNRLKNYNYSSTGYYYVTICSNNRQNIFGKCKNVVGEGLASSHNKIQLSDLGQIIDKQWRDIPKQFGNIEIDNYVIMPNHIHGILIVNNQKREDARPSPTVSDVICSFKSKCTVEYIRLIKRNDLNISGKIWQRSFFDHVIRNDRSLKNIREYIKNNPATWDIDEENINKKQTAMG